MFSKFEEVQEILAINYPGLHCGNTYCLVTGKVTGYSDEAEALIDSLSGDLEEIADDVAMRVLASMRPSLFWNKFRIDSLEEMRQTRPVELAAYLLNRLFAPIGNVKNPLAENHDKIRTFAKLDQTALEFDDFDSLVHILLEIDAKLNLKSLAAPFQASDIWGCRDLKTILALIQPWYDKQIKFWTRSVAESKFIQANPLAKTAFFESWMAKKPQPKEVEKKLRKKSDNSFFESLYQEIAGSSIGMAPQAISKVESITPKVSIAMPAWGQIQINKDSES